MNIFKFFNDNFKTKCIVTPHAIERINSRFTYKELKNIRLLINACMRNRPLTTWKDNASYAIYDERFEFALICSITKNEVKIISAIRGKHFNDCEIIHVSIKREEAEQELELFKKAYKNKNLHSPIR